jgi:C4-dicarboxylate-specific signal transduction histidine kinase
MRLSEAVEVTRQQLRQAEQNLVRSEKMASLGYLSAGIIHEINNPLNYAMAALTMIEGDSKHLPERFQADHLDALADMRDGLSRVNEITSSLRKFAHPDSGVPVEIRVNDCVNTALRLMASELKGEVKVRNHISENLTVWATGSKLTQVFINLIHNSVHALRMKTFDAGQGAEIVLEAAVDSGLVTISVIDNGTGIPATVIGKIFEPFFTTKDIGQGTGLGLGICYQILSAVDARIEAHSKEGEFTRFDLLFKQPDFS